MKIPNKIKIGGLVYDVALAPEDVVNKEFSEISGEQNTDIVGYSSFRKLKIAIVQDFNDSIKGNIFFHEVMEAIQDIYGLEISHQVITTIASAFFQALNDADLLVKTYDEI